MNALNIDLTGRVVKLTDGTLFKCEDGFGCHTFTSGTAVFGTTITGQEMRVDGAASIDRLATEDEVAHYNQYPYRT